MRSSEGQALAEQEHHRQIERAQMRNTNTYLQSVPAKKLYFETSAKTGQGVAELFDFIQTTLLEEMNRQSGGGGGGGRGEGKRRGSRKKVVDQSIRVGEGSGQGPDKSCCSN